MDSRDFDTDTVALSGSSGSSEITLSEGILFANRYRIGRVLGAGGSAIVYAAWDTQVRQDIALKVLRPDKESERSLNRFRREVNVARRIKAPNIVTVYDIGQVDTSVWISMELVEGETLRSLIRNGPLPINRAVEIGARVLAALGALHEHGVIHRDVKPGNIMITPTGEARLMDLGLARFYEGDETRATTTEHVVGTLEYLSPEQALGEELDPRSDLYSFGLVLFEMLAGRLPYGSQSTLGHLISHVSKAAPDVRTFRRDVPPWLARLVAHLLEKKREHRYQTAARVANDLEGRRASRWFGVRRFQSAAVAAVCTILVVGATYSGWQAWSDRQFNRFIGDGGETGVALDRTGRELWRMDGLVPGIRATTARLAVDEPPRIVGVLGDPTDATDPRQRIITVLDTQTGEVLRSHSLGTYTPFQSVPFSDTFVASDFDTVDVDHDGAEEVVGAWFHQPYWPSFVVFYDAEIGTPLPILYSSGYHRFFGTQDLDGDGIDELLFFGVNNRLGWHAAIAAVSVARLKNQKSLLTDVLAASTPDATWSSTSDLMLVWYTLLPPFGASTRHPIIDAAGRRIIVDGPDRSISVGFDGFIQGSNGTVSDGDRNAARFSAYQLVRDHLAHVSVQEWEDAADAARQALAAAQQASDGILEDWIHQSLCVTLIRLGRIDEAESRLATMIEDPNWDSNIAWSAATAYHLAGDLPHAVEWYRRVLHRPGDAVPGRKLYEFLEGTVFALGEMRRWEEARTEVRSYRSRASTRGGETGAPYGSWIEWRSTGRLPDQMEPGEPDMTRYLELEYALLRGEDPESILTRAEALRSRLSGKSALLDSLRAECLLKIDRADDAYQLAGSAWHNALMQRQTDPLIRAHFDLVTERMIRAADAAGKGDEADKARAELERVWYRPTPQ